MDIDIRNLDTMGINLVKIMNALCENENLKKYLVHNDKEPLKGPSVPTRDVFNKRVTVVPQVSENERAISTVAVYVAAFYPNEENEEAFDISLMVEVFVPLTQWMVKDERQNLRPFLIMQEIYKSFNNLDVDGIGRVHRGRVQLNFLTKEISSYRMNFSFTMYV